MAAIWMIAIGCVLFVVPSLLDYGNTALHSYLDRQVSRDFQRRPRNISTFWQEPKGKRNFKGKKRWKAND